MIPVFHLLNIINTGVLHPKWLCIIIVNILHVIFTIPVSVVRILKLLLNLCIDVMSRKYINVLHRLLQRPSSGSSIYSFNQEEIREKLQAFPGGSIDLLKQASGIAVLTVNNPSRMNAFSGEITTVCFSECKLGRIAIDVSLHRSTKIGSVYSPGNFFIPGSMMVELEEKVSQLESWTDGKGLIVQGAAGTFCSGSDLNAVRAISNPQVEEGRSFCLHCDCRHFFYIHSVPVNVF